MSLAVDDLTMGRNVLEYPHPTMSKYMHTHTHLKLEFDVMMVQNQKIFKLYGLNLNNFLL